MDIQYISLDKETIGVRIKINDPKDLDYWSYQISIRAWELDIIKWYKSIAKYFSTRE